MTYKKIVNLDQTGLEPWAYEELKKYCEELVMNDSDPVDEQEAIVRASGADVLLVSWRTPVTRAVIDACPEIKYIGMCCSLYDEKSANVDIAYARSKGIKVLGVRDYGDEGLVEFIISELIRLLHGFGAYQFSEKQEELTGKTLGIIGLGTTGYMLAERARAFGMKVVYYSRTRKEHLESDWLSFRPLHEMLSEAQMVSTHLPKFTEVMDNEAFEAFGNGKILINTSLEPTFELDAFEQWIARPSNFLITDRGGLGSKADILSSMDRVITTQKVSGFTRQAEGRLSQKVLDNLKSTR
ncbi:MULTISPECIES: NAD(P)-dependent oxidoreductase [unclassified Fusibacter]|uniref:NAD(P)-dependent oxidoreductase n=1 Tax=unclassified Fusibacter TaxID=2624464 RepID=UPI0010131078|nr:MULTISPECIES: NAD(P)-dependent oxidoreductase [unclassified Fusibacter]MCK8060137.1 dihydrofolate reductase [Fusibacter sp. A2]NPE22279.1 dihydrofolate reductase [Fusibacter sp. A1]RXV61052.1 dihydrofolate reductase [Fusibacter sp. A1]